MATSPNNANRIFDGGINFLPGVDSLVVPQLLDGSSLSWMINMTNKGGVLTTRPGYTSIARYPDGKAQGFTIFTPTSSIPHHVVAVSGKLYTSPYPFTVYTQLPNIQFDAFVDQIVFKEALQTSDNGTLIDPKLVLMMQDGKTKAAFWDGSQSRHLVSGGATNETPIGLWMEWVGSRLWVSRGNEIFAGDIQDPLHFTETAYLSGGGSFQPFDGKTVNGLARTADNKALLIQTIDNTTVIRAGITDRSTWSSTPDFISLLFPGVGCVSGKSYSYNNGELWWFSVQGARRFTQVGSTIQISRNNIASLEMERSFTNLSPTLNRICSFSAGSYIGFSVPSGDVFNRHTWVIDTSPESLVKSEAGAAWQGIWMGTRPVEWATATINGTSRTFYLSQDRDGGVRIWETFKADQTDDGNQIYWSIEGPGLRFGADGQLSFKKFLFTEVHLTNVLGPVSFTVDYRGDYGCWKNILDLEICALRCKQLSCDDQNMAPSAQNRYYRTSEALASCDNGTGPFSDDIGTFFQNRFRGYGVAGIQKYRSNAMQWPESSSGACNAGDFDADGIQVCVPFLCCDEEVDYISKPRSHGYGSSFIDAEEVISSI